MAARDSEVKNASIFCLTLYKEALRKIASHVGNDLMGMEVEDGENEMKISVNLCSMDSPTDTESTSKVDTIEYKFDKESDLLKKEAELSRRESLLLRREKLLDQAWQRFNAECDQWSLKKQSRRSSSSSSLSRDDSSFLDSWNDTPLSPRNSDTRESNGKSKSNVRSYTKHAYEILTFKQLQSIRPAFAESVLTKYQTERRPVYVCGLTIHGLCNHLSFQGSHLHVHVKGKHKNDANVPVYKVIDYPTIEQTDDSILINDN